jgi:hypothetical protein
MCSNGEYCWVVMLFMMRNGKALGQCEAEQGSKSVYGLNVGGCTDGGWVAVSSATKGGARNEGEQAQFATAVAGTRFSNLSLLLETRRPALLSCSWIGSRKKTHNLFCDSSEACKPPVCVHRLPAHPAMQCKKKPTPYIIIHRIEHHYLSCIKQST